MTVDWSRWLELTPDEQRALQQQYRDIVKRESMENAAAFKRSFSKPPADNRRFSR